MFVDFNSLKDSSRIWIYQSNREFTDQEVSEMKIDLEKFVESWTRHGDNLEASFQIKYNQFIILAVDESFKDVSGCSIDASTHLLKKFENRYDFDLFDKMKTTFKDGDHINTVSLFDFRNFVNEQKINRSTIVFNNLITTKMELEKSWEVTAENSWHQRYF